MSLKKVSNTLVFPNSVKSIQRVFELMFITYKGTEKLKILLKLKLTYLMHTFLDKNDIQIRQNLFGNRNISSQSQVLNLHNGFYCIISVAYFSN